MATVKRAQPNQGGDVRVGAHNRPMDTTTYPVRFRNEVLGAATCEAGAKTVAARKMPFWRQGREHWTARLADAFDDDFNYIGKAWYVGTAIR